MKKLFAVVTGVIVLCASCVSLQDREMTANEKAQAQAQVLGKVTTEFHSWQFFHIINKNNIKTKVYQKLLKQAHIQYEGNIDVRNITIIGGLSGWEALNVLFNTGGVGGGGSYLLGGDFEAPIIPVLAIGIGIGAGNTQKIIATGEVVLFRDRAGTPSENTPVPSGNTGNTPAPGGNF